MQCASNADNLQEAREILAAAEMLTKDYALCATVVAAGKCSEALLACCVPDCHFQSLVLDVDELEPEVHAWTSTGSLKVIQCFSAGGADKAEIHGYVDFGEGEIKYLLWERCSRQRHLL